MDFTLTEEQIMIRDAARDFAKTELLPGVIERDEKQQFPTEEVKQLRNSITSNLLSKKLTKRSRVVSGDLTDFFKSLLKDLSPMLE